MRWRINVECQPSADVLARVQHLTEVTVDMLSEALSELGLDPAVESQVVP